MKTIRNKMVYLTIVTLCMSDLSFATIAKFQLIASTPTQIVVPANRSAIVAYTVTNQTNYDRTLTMVPIMGVTQQTDTIGMCGNPFTLAAHDSCSLSLLVDGSKITNATNMGPIICKTQTGTNNADRVLCSQASSNYQLGVTVGSPVPSGLQNVYVSNWSNQSISLCSVNSLTGSLEYCNIGAVNDLFKNPEAITTNSAGTHLYVANIGGGVTLCQLDGQGNISGCTDTGSGFDGPDGIAFNADETIIYVSNVNLTTVTFCQVDSSTGALTSCAATGTTFLAKGQSDLTVHPTLPIVYVSNYLDGTVTRCNIGGGGALTCTAPSISGFVNPEGIFLSPSGDFAYVTNHGNGTISYCSVTAGAIGSCNTTTSGTFAGFGSVVFNPTDTLAYVPSSATSVSVCLPVAGDLTDCVDSGGTGFTSPSGIAFP